MVVFEGMARPHLPVFWGTHKPGDLLQRWSSYLRWPPACIPKGNENRYLWRSNEEELHFTHHCLSLWAVLPGLPHVSIEPGADDQKERRIVLTYHCLPEDVPRLSHSFRPQVNKQPLQPRPVVWMTTPFDENLHHLSTPFLPRDCAGLRRCQYCA